MAKKSGSPKKTELSGSIAKTTYKRLKGTGDFPKVNLALALARCAKLIRLVRVLSTPTTRSSSA
jgi:hypothetical protein